MFPNLDKDKFIHGLFILFSLTVPALCQGQRDVVHGNLIQFNDNGLSCWFQDERAILDTVNSNMVLGTDASSLGTCGQLATEPMKP